MPVVFVESRGRIVYRSSHPPYKGCVAQMLLHRPRFMIPSLSRPLRIGFVGLGNWGLKLHSAFMRTGQVEDRVLCDSAPERVPLGRDATSDWQATCRHPDLDAIVIATPPQTHAMIALEALRRGKHVFVEKPMTIRARDAEELVAVAEEVHRTLVVGHILEHHPAIEGLYRRVRDEDGPIRLRTRRSSATENGEAAWWSLAPHDLSVALALFDETPILMRVRESEDIEGGWSARLAFSRGTAEIDVGCCQDKTRSIEVRRGDQRFIFDDMSSTKLMQGHISRPLRPVEISGWEPLLRQAERFVGAVVARAEGNARGGLDVVRLLEAGCRSFYAREPVTLDSVIPRRNVSRVSAMESRE